MRPFPPSATRPGATRAFIDAYRAAFDADPSATFCAGEINGVVLVVAPSESKQAQRLREFIEIDLNGVLQRDVSDSSEAENSQASADE